MKRALLFETRRETVLVIAGTGLIACTYGLVRLAYGLFLPDIRASLSMSSAVAAYVSSGASVAYCVGALCGLAAATQSRRLVGAAVVTAGAGSAGMALASDVRVFVPMAVLASTGAGLASPGLVAVVERNVATSRAQRAQATVNAGTGPGLVAAGVLALVLLPQWRLGFAIGAVLTAVAGVGVLLLDRPCPVGGPTTAGRSVPRALTGRWWVGLARPRVAAVLLGGASAAVWTYGRTQLIAEGAGDGASTLAWIALGLGGTLAVVTTGPLSGHHPARGWTLSTAAVAAAIAVLGLVAGSVPVALVACAVFGWGFVAASSALIAWASVLVPGRAAAGTSLLFVTLVLGQAVGSAVSGAVAGRHGLATAFLLAAAVTVLAALCGLSRPPLGVRGAHPERSAPAGR